MEALTTAVTTLPELDSWRTPELLVLYGRILDELIRRDVVRTRNAPAGDYGEWLVARTVRGALEPNSNKSWDITTPTGQRIQVKTRVVGPTTRGSAIWSVFRSFDFDMAAFVRLDQATYEVINVTVVPAASLEPIARYSHHVAGYRVPLSTRLSELPGAHDITQQAREALAEVERLG